jgi:hypothetical protein
MRKVISRNRHSSGTNTEQKVYKNTSIMESRNDKITLGNTCYFDTVYGLDKMKARLKIYAQGKSN